jgi:hypothetical protein
MVTFVSGFGADIAAATAAGGARFGGLPSFLLILALTVGAGWLIVYLVRRWWLRTRGASGIDNRRTRKNQ